MKLYSACMWVHMIVQGESWNINLLIHSLATNNY